MSRLTSPTYRERLALGVDLERRAAAARSRAPRDRSAARRCRTSNARDRSRPAAPGGRGGSPPARTPTSRSSCRRRPCRRRTRRRDRAARSSAGDVMPGYRRHRPTSAQRPGTHEPVGGTTPRWLRAVAYGAGRADDAAVSSTAGCRAATARFPSAGATDETVRAGTDRPRADTSVAGFGMPAASMKHSSRKRSLSSAVCCRSSRS